MLVSCPISTLMDYSTRPYAITDKPLLDASTYCHLISRLIYLTTTCLGFTHVVHNLSQFIYVPTKNHSQTISHILHYLKKTLNLSIFLSTTNFLQLKAFRPFYWVGCPNIQYSMFNYKILYLSH